MEDAKKQYRKLSMLVHPDKNRDNERAQVAFDVVNRAYKELQDNETFEFCKKIVEEAKKRVEDELKEEIAKKKARGEDGDTPSDNQRQEQAVRVWTFKLFAELEQKKQKMDQREVEERKRKREEELSMEEKGKQQEEWNKRWEESRDARVNSWRSFVGGSVSEDDADSNSNNSSNANANANANNSDKKPPIIGSILDTKKKSKRAKVFRPPALKTESRK